MDLQVIKTLCEKRKGGLVKLASDIGMSVQNLHRCIRENKIQAQDLEKIARELNVPVSYFFDEEPTTPRKNKRENESELVESLHEQIDLLKGNLADVRENLADKERIIKLYERQHTQ